MLTDPCLALAFAWQAIAWQGFVCANGLRLCMCGKMPFESTARLCAPQQASKREDARKKACYLGNTVTLHTQRMRELSDDRAGSDYATAYQALAAIGREQSASASKSEANKLKNRLVRALLLLADPAATATLLGAGGRVAEHQAHNSVDCRRCGAPLCRAAMCSRWLLLCTAVTPNLPPVGVSGGVSGRTQVPQRPGIR